MIESELCMYVCISEQCMMFKWRRRFRDKYKQPDVWWLIGIERGRGLQGKEGCSCAVKHQS